MEDLLWIPWLQFCPRIRILTFVTLLNFCAKLSVRREMSQSVEETNLKRSLWTFSYQPQESKFVVWIFIVLLITNCTFLNTSPRKTTFWSMHHSVCLSSVPKDGEWAKLIVLYVHSYKYNSFTCVDVWSGYRGVTDLPPCPLQATVSVKFHQHEVGRTGQRRGKSIWMMLPVLIIIAFST